MDTTVTLKTANRERLREIQQQLAADKGYGRLQPDKSRAVSVDEALEYLFKARDELAKLVAAEYEGGV